MLRKEVLWGLLARVALLSLCVACTPQEPSIETAARHAATSGSALGTGGTGIPPRGKYVLVNVPMFELTAFQDGAPLIPAPLRIVHSNTSGICMRLSKRVACLMKITCPRIQNAKR